MKKVLIGLAIAVAILLIAATLFVSKMDELIADAIRTEGSAVLGAKVDVSSVQTKLKEGVAIINGLSIANPAGYKNTNALTVESFSADVDYETQVVDAIIIDKPIINAEIVDLNKNNFQDLLNGMPDAAEEPETETTDEEELTITIKSFQLKNAQVNVVNDKLGQQSFVMKDFVINNLSGNVDQISDTLITGLTNHISDQVKDFAKAALGEIAKQKLKQEATEQINKALEEKVTEKIKGLKGLKLNIK